MYTLGIDPDSKDMSFAFWGEDGPEDAGVVHVVGRSSNYEMLTMLTDLPLLGSSVPPTLIAIEGQQIDRRRARPRDLFKLAHMTGAVALRMRQEFPDSKIIIPTPLEWKGKIAKHAHQARLYKELGWGYTIAASGANRYAVPVHPPHQFDHITKGQWKHVGDALLLARWAHDQAS